MLEALAHDTNLLRPIHSQRNLDEGTAYRHPVPGCPFRCPLQVRLLTALLPVVLPRQLPALSWSIETLVNRKSNCDYRTRMDVAVGAGQRA